jgi:hypothetical protein
MAVMVPDALETIATRLEISKIVACGIENLAVQFLVPEVRLRKGSRCDNQLGNHEFR